MNRRILLAVDGSESTEKEIDYVASVVSGRDDVRFHLLHVLPPLMITEYEGALDRATDLLDRWRQRLSERGVAQERIDSATIQVTDRSPLVDKILEVASDVGCDTIAVGRRSLPWYRELFHAHLADELVRHATGRTVWVIE